MPKDGKERLRSRHQDEFEDAVAGRAMSSNPLQMTAELIPPFTGQDKTYSVDRWVQDIEDNAEIYGWTALQQLLVARRSLSGTASLWLKSERPFRSWEDLKAAVSKEFPDDVDIKTIHEMMTTRKKRQDEDCIDYMLVMKELGKRGGMADQVAIKYIVDGIVDDEINKMMLYGVTTYSDLKEKLKIYETIKEKMKNQGRGTYQQNGLYNHHQTQRPSKKNICYNCGEKDHMSSECPSKQRGTKCFKCNAFGHISRECNGRSGSGTSASETTSKWRREVGSTHGGKAMCVDTSDANQSERSDSRLRSDSMSHNDSSANEVKCQDAIDVNDVNVNKVDNQQRPLKNIVLCGKTFEALVDSGSDVNLIR